MDRQTDRHKKEKLKTCIALRGISELRSVTCHMGSHSVTCHPTQVSVPCLNPSRAGRYSIYLPRRDGRLSWPCYSETQPPGVELATSQSRIRRPNHSATKQHVYICVCITVYYKFYVIAMYIVFASPAIWHRWTCLALTPARQAGNWFTYPRGIEGWVDSHPSE